MLLLKRFPHRNLNFETIHDHYHQIIIVLQKLISIKNHLCPKCSKLKDVTLKTEVQIKYKQYRNLLSTSMKESKTS